MNDNPLFENLTTNKREVNVKTNFQTHLLNLLVSAGALSHDLKRAFGPEEIFKYVISILHSPTYRKRYKEFLCRDFPRIPQPGSLEIFRELGRLGDELIPVHLLESPVLNKCISRLIGNGSYQVEKIHYSEETIWIDKARSIGFKGVPERIWNFYLGGYQICEKWLNSRKGRILSNDDINQYQRIIVAINEIMRIMNEIDGAIEAHGGWPGAFTISKSTSN